MTWMWGKQNNVFGAFNGKQVMFITWNNFFDLETTAEKLGRMVAIQL